MARSNAAGVEEYLQELPAERRAVVAQVRQVILNNLPLGYQERMNWGMISYEAPLERYPKTYNKQPLAGRIGSLLPPDAIEPASLDDLQAEVASYEAAPQQSIRELVGHARTNGVA